MKCELCGEADPDLIVLLPLHQLDGKLDTMACEKCARKSSAYCIKHDRPHLGFIDASTACTRCIQEMVETEKEKALSIKKRIWAALPREEISDIHDAAALSAFITNGDRTQALLRLVVCKVLRSGGTIEGIILQVESEHSVDCLLWR